MTTSTPDQINLWLTIPTGTRRKYLDDIIKESNIPKDRIVIVNTVECEPVEGVHNLWDLDEVNIHRWWNKGINFAEENGATHVAVLNDDLQLADDPLNRIANAVSNGNHKIGIPIPFLGHICGYCWVLSLESGIRPDENYRWWYGDNDLFLQAEGWIVGVPAKVRHIEPNWQTSSNPYLMELTKADAEYFHKKWKL